MQSGETEQEERLANLRAQQITGRTYISHSQLALLRTCPRKFAYQYVENAPADFVPSNLLFGGSIHQALETYFQAKLEGVGITHEALLAAYMDAWKREKEKAKAPLRYNKEETEETLFALADRMLSAFLNSPLAHLKGEVIGVEEEMLIILDENLPDLLARVDLVIRDENALHVIDFKTSRSRWTPEKAVESGEQLMLYAVTVARMSEHLGVPVNLHFSVLTKAKMPVVQVLPVPTDLARIEVMRTWILQVWDAIQAGNFYPNPSPMNCTTCQFKSRCPVFAGK
jgi:CRISPR/Cas system-associated exonuclease Cas4 (RecB family)